MKLAWLMKPLPPQPAESAWDRYYLGPRAGPQCTLTTAPSTYAPVTVSAEALAEAQRQIGALKQLREENESMLTKWLFNPSVFVSPLKVKDDLEASSHMADAAGAFAEPGAGQADYRMREEHHLTREEMQRRAIQGAVHAAGVDPLDVVYDGARLRTLLAQNASDSQEAGPPLFLFTPAQRAAVSAHWSAALRAKVAASAAADKARETSVVVDLEDW